jgi:hypothetical protein
LFREWILLKPVFYLNSSTLKELHHMVLKKFKKTNLIFFLFSVSFAVWLICISTSGCRNENEIKTDATAHIHEILGTEETCMNCHSDFTGFAPAHNPEIIGCSPCHGGQPRESDLAEAHVGMKLVPGNLSDVNQTCGAANCHADIAHRVENSLMTSMSGVISVNRFVFGESENLSALAHIKNLRKDHAADVHLRQLCASCHLGNEKEKPAPVHEKSRGGGCIACHLDYSQKADFQSNATIEKQKFHPAINLKVTDNHCFGCHSRSGRISTNFEGWHETNLDAESYSNEEGFRQLADGRIFRKIKSDVHHDLGLECIDCHSAKEVMGDGNQYFHKEEAVKIRCEDCHFNEMPFTKNYDNLDIESKKILQLRNADYLDAQFVVGRESGDALVNVIIGKDGKPQMVGKNSGERYALSSLSKNCSRGTAHDALHCNACHTEWAPQCIGCHNVFEPEAPAFDHIDKQKSEGKWTEYLGEFFAEAPTLGVVGEHQNRQIQPFVPGMIMTIDKSDFPGEEESAEIFHRLFAPSAPHTTNRVGRACESCHNDPLALGYGRGELIFETENGIGRWRFISEYENSPQDGLPQDAWIGFLEFPKVVSATRPNARPFTVLEQKKILRVGACLTCHKGNSEVMSSALEDFEKTLKAIKEDCVIPVWD